MNKKKLGLLLLFSPLIVFILIIVLFSLLPSDSPAIIDTLSKFMLFIGSPILFCIGLILLIKNRDKNKKLISNDVSKKRMLIGEIILFGVIIPILFYLGASATYDLVKTKIVQSVVSEHCYPKYIFLPQEDEEVEKEDEIEYANKQESPKLEKGSVEEIKNKLLTLIPKEYEVVEKDCDGAFTLQGICNEWYQVYPKEYTDMEMTYLNQAGLQYFSNVINIKIAGQVGDVIYSNEQDRWVYRETEKEDVFLEIKEFGDTSVSYISLGGSHAFYDYYIMDDSDEAIVLFIPSWNRIRCDFMEEGIEKKQCEEYLSSFWEETNHPDYVPEEVYKEYYKSLLDILKDI